MKHGYPPRGSLLISIVLVALPVLITHLAWAKKKENVQHIRELNSYQQKLSAGKLILYSLGLVSFAFLVWGITQPLNVLITQRLFNWLPNWFTIQDMRGYSKEAIQITLICNLLLNGLLAPFIEEIYFRGYLLPRMEVWGKRAFVVNALLFSLYHFWQPYIYLTLIIALLPMTYMVWKTKDLRLSILTHCLLNLIGALLSFAALPA
ncbi:CPBP family intramembrane metalloprotease [Flavihumibacter sp. R14]|nr:CPBP family intramembrane metalloprotease [Flavihumibacter soli]